MSESALVDVRDLHVTFALPNRNVYAVNGASFTLAAGGALGIVGESGSGKSVAAQSIARLVNAPGISSTGEIRVLHSGRQVDALSLQPNGRQMREIRASTISVIFQEPMRSLHPMFSVGWQISEGIRRAGATKKQALERSIELLGLVGLPDPAGAVRRYPHELSGGMRQRVMIAVALAGAPRLLIADEPTTALDVTIQAQILELLGRLRRELDMAVIMISHDLGVIAQSVDAVAVMYLGQVVEYGPVGTVMNTPRHPYTQGLLATTPRLDSVIKTDLPTLRGNIPELSASPQSCVFLDRCPHARAVCRRLPEALPVGPSQVRCWQYTSEWGAP